VPRGGGPQTEARGYWTLTYVLLLLISIALMAVAYVVGTGTLWAHLLNELGIAGVVGFVLALTIERLSAREFEERAKRERNLLQEEFRTLASQERADLKKDVFYYTYGRNLPQPIRDDLDHYFLQADFIRSKLYLQFDLTVETDPYTKEDYVRSNCLTSSHIENLTGERQVFPIDHAIDASPSAALKDQVKYLEFHSSGSESEISWDEAALGRMTDRDEEQIALTLPKDKQVVVLADRPTILKIRYQGIRVLEGGGIYFFFTTHTCDLELTAHVKNCDLDVAAVAYSPHPLVQTDRHEPMAGYYNWTINQPLLAYQAIRVTWHRPSTAAKQTRGSRDLYSDVTNSARADCASSG
jgi:hypothetical protein